MRFIIAGFAIFASSTLAAKYAAGDICHSNTECEKNCVDKQYTVAEQDGGFVFVCDPSVANPVQWYAMACTEIGSGRGPQPYKFNAEKTETACKSIGGQACGSCVVSAERGEDENLRGKWLDNCTGGLARFSTQISVMADRRGGREAELRVSKCWLYSSIFMQTTYLDRLLLFPTPTVCLFF